jgi:hypothetical protein
LVITSPSFSEVVPASEPFARRSDPRAKQEDFCEEQAYVGRKGDD